MARLNSSGSRRAFRVIETDYIAREAFWDFHRRKQRWAVLIAHRRAGKTVACLMDMLDHAIFDTTGNARYAYVAPFYVQAKSVAWDYLKTFARPFLASSPNESELRVDLKNGSRISLYGGDNQDRLRGLALDGVILDEFADMSPSLWGQVVRPALADRKGWATIIGTVKGKNQLWEFYEYGLAHPDLWYSSILRASETGILDPYELEDAKRSMTENEYLAEFECDPTAAILGAYFGKEMALADREGRISDNIARVDADVHTAWDFGHGANMAVWCFQVGPEGPIVLDFIQMTGAYFNDYIAEIKRRGYTGIAFVPHDARVPNFETGRSRVETLFAEGIKCDVVSNHKVEDGINAAKLTIGRTRFDAKCGSGLEALRQYRQEYDDKLRVFKNNPRHDWASHPADAFRYLSMAWKEYIQPSIDKAAPPRMASLQDMTIDEYMELNHDAGGKRERV